MKQTKKITRYTYYLSILYVSLLLGFTSCTTKNDSPETESTIVETSTELLQLSSKQFSSSEMQLGTFEEKPFHEIVKATGMFDVPPKNRATISTYFGGTVKDIKLLPGEKVKKGQRLFTLENPDYVQLQQDFLEVQGQLVSLKLDFERQKNLAQDNVTSQKNYLQAESKYTVMQVKFESLRKKLGLMGIHTNNLTIGNIHTTINITSPIDGYVTAVNISRGSFLSPAQTAITIVNTEHLHLELNIFERDLPKVVVGQPIVFKLQNNSQKEYQASVYLVNKTVDVQNRTIGIHGHLADEKMSSIFNPGMYVEADILTTSQSKQALPQSAVVEIDGKYYVLVLKTSSPDGYTFKKHEVITGVTNNGFVEILNAQDFENKAQILINGSFNLITE